ncbi:MAG: arylsulfatase [bacterium]|nr:arylsulfatase [bacterium]
MHTTPNIVLILNDDMGYSDLGCYGGEIHTPHLDTLADRGIRFTQFYNTARCSPSRASLLTGLHPHQTGVGILTEHFGPESYAGNLNERCVTIAEVLQASGYRTYMSGKWHIAHDWFDNKDSWPRQRGFQKFYGTVAGAGSYFEPKTLTRDNQNIEEEARQEDFYYTDAISHHAVTCIQEHCEDFPDTPFFQYVAYTAPHWPLHALEDDIAAYQGRFDAGWDRLREERLERMVAMGILDASWTLSERDPAQPPWEDAEHKAWQTRRMEVYAAQIDRMDRGIGKIIRTLTEIGQLENTLILFLSDNGGCAEEVQSDWQLVAMHIANTHTRSGEDVRIGNTPNVMPGAENTYQSYGVPWANLSNTPFRMYKHWVHEGGIATPLIMHWPAGITDRGKLRHQPAQLTDVMATILDITGADYPEMYNEQPILPCEGTSLAPVFEDPDYQRSGLLFWEHEGNAAVRDGMWKLVKNFLAQQSATPGFDPPNQRGEWELYNLENDRTETYNLAQQYPERVNTMKTAYQQWADRCGVIPREKILDLMKKT